jgi:cysteine synthase A
MEPGRPISAGGIAQSALEAIGNTPLVRLNRLVDRESADVYVKLESVNPTGSYKDRMALSMIERAEARGDLRPGMTVVEYTGGSTGTALAFVCAVKGYSLKVVSSDAFSAEKLRSMEAFGAELHMVPSEGGQTTPDLVPRMRAAAEGLAAAAGTYFTDQLENPDNRAGYAGMGQEILDQSAGKIDVFCAAVGSAGMAMGVGRALKQANSATRVTLFEPAESPQLTQGKGGRHRIEGIGLGMVPPLLDPEIYDRVLTVSQQDAFDTARQLASQEGLLAGTSSGLNVAGALTIASELGSGHSVVTVIVDSGLKYLTEGPFSEGPA